MESVTVISSSRKSQWKQTLRDLWTYRDLLISFVERDTKIRYKQTLLGVLWVVLQPLAMAGAFAFILGRGVKMPTDGLPILLFYISGFVLWTNFSQSLNAAALSLEAHASLVSKVYFPRILIPIAAVLSTLPDLAIGTLVLLGAALWFGKCSWMLLAFPLLIILVWMIAIGLGLGLAALNAQYRDIRHAVPFMIQFGMLATPILYPASIVPASLHFWFLLNPLTTPLLGIRTILGGAPLSMEWIVWNTATAFLILIVGVLFFQQRESLLADSL